ncbi:hypothetical protein SSA02_11770 [Swaminathania salitolerans]|uniref:Uncharacterized protein n=1 Tax=Swaminathania salitolerans TaxID=182838 RepID=A0A511BQU6_9PROT|nr:hypothetical protein SSA02_11770 [Swaminathania salitolerans]
MSIVHQPGTIFVMNGLGDGRSHTRGTLVRATRSCPGLAQEDDGAVALPGETILRIDEGTVGA